MVNFYEAYKELRNRMRKYSRQSVVRVALQRLCHPTQNNLEDLRIAPWQVLLLVKWICQDKLASDTGENITLVAFDELRQRLWKFPVSVNSSTRDTRPGNLFFRQLTRPQIGFQQDASLSFTRESALLVQQPASHQLCNLFKDKVGLSILDFLDIAFATYVAIVDGKQKLDISWFVPLQNAYGVSTINAFISCVSRTYPELVAFCRALPGADKKVASELYEFPVVSRYPFLRTGNTLECWHPAIFYRGIEGFVHSVLSEAGQTYINYFSELFEEHVVVEARRMGVPFFDEKAIMKFIPSGTKVPDGLLSFPTCNIFIESKAGLFREPVMTIGNSKIFADRTEPLQTAIKQGWSASTGIRSKGSAPTQILEAKRDYLLIITNKDLRVGGGITFESMLPAGTFDFPRYESSQWLSLSNIFFLSIDDFERLVSNSSETGFDLPSILDDCVKADLNPQTRVSLFEQHLDNLRVPIGYSKLVESAFDDITIRLNRAL